MFNVYLLCNKDHSDGTNLKHLGFEQKMMKDLLELSIKFQTMKHW